MRIYTKKTLNEYHQSLTYDDISLIPVEVSEIRSRTEAKTSCSFLGLNLSLPVVSSPMETVTGLAMAKELTKLGCLGILNRFDSSTKEIIKDEKNGDNIKAVSIALNTPLNEIEKLVEGNYIICIDTANAKNRQVLNKCEEIKKKYDTKVIVGNIAHGSSLKQLEDSGADAVRVGIGGGSVCTTSIQTGIGIGQVSSMLNIYYSKK